MKKLTGILTQLFHERVIGGSGSMSLERESYVNLNFSKQNEHFGIRVEHELDSQKKERKKERKKRTWIVSWSYYYFRPHY